MLQSQVLAVIHWWLYAQDSAYEAAGARMVDSSGALGADVVLKIRPPTSQVGCYPGLAGGTGMLELIPTHAVLLCTYLLTYLPTYLPAGGIIYEEGSQVSGDEADV
jgi:hypothetical protein